MLPLVPLGPRARVAAALVAAGACGAAAIAGFAACLTAPPPDIGTSTNERPEIVHDAVNPPGGLLTAWPLDGFVVPVLLPDPTVGCRWSLFDQDLEMPSPPPGLTVYANEACVTSVVDGGAILQDFQFGGPTGPTDGHCHIYTFIVAHGFSANAESVPDSIGGDSVIWEYLPPGALCNFYDAGALQDGAFPPVDAGKDGPLVTPESGPLDSGGEQ
jgi:hypothetical protein